MRASPPETDPGKPFRSTRFTRQPRPILHGCTAVGALHRIAGTAPGCYSLGKSGEPARSTFGTSQNTGEDAIMTDNLATTIQHARGQSIGDLLRRSAQRLPAKTAIICGNTVWTYAEMDAICNRLARGLLKSGIAKGERVAVLSRNSHAFAALRFALARIGAVLVPINFMLNPDEVRFILASSGATLLAVGPDFIDAARAASAKDCAVKSMVWLPGEESSAPPAGMTTFDDLLDADATPVTASVDSRDLAQIIYTSGTESLPKGAMLSHEAVMWQYVSCIVEGGMAEEDVVLHALPLYHCAQLDVFLGPAIYLGSTNIIIGKPAPDLILSLIAAHGVTSFFAPPTVWIGMLRSPAFDETDLSTLQKGYYGASIMPVEVLLELQRRLPKVRFWNFYGQTEIAPLATVLKPEDQLRKAGSAGKPALNVETRVVDSEMNDVSVGEIGEIVHRSPHLLSGYYNNPEKTAEAFTGGWFHSGDLATVDEDGYITVVDRMKDMIKTGGENVASREVEEMIYRLPQVSEVAVVGLPDPRWIEAVTAIVVVKDGQTLTGDAVVDHCAQSMAHFKTPKRVIFVDSLPKNPSGKLLKRELRQRYLETSPATAAG
jgi:fatty-acyl-CoA synthase